MNIQLDVHWLWGFPWGPKGNTNNYLSIIRVSRKITVFQCVCNTYPLKLSQFIPFTINFLLTFLWYSIPIDIPSWHQYSTSHLKNTYSWYSYVSHGFPMVLTIFLRFSYGFPMFPMVFLWFWPFSYCFPIVFHASSHGFPYAVARVRCRFSVASGKPWTEALPGSSGIPGGNHRPP